MSEAPSPIGDNLSNVFIGEHVDMLDSYERLLIRGYVPQTVFWELSERERRIRSRQGRTLLMILSDIAYCTSIAGV